MAVAVHQPRWLRDVIRLVVLTFVACLSMATGPALGDPPDDGIEMRLLADAPRVEQQTLDDLTRSQSWARRAIAALRLERYDCNPSAHVLNEMLYDRDWRVRSFAIRSLARRGVPQGEEWFEHEEEPRVVRTLLRNGYAIELDRIERGVRFLDRSSNLADKLLGAEIAAATKNEKLSKLAHDSVRTIILRMNKVEGGPLGPRLSVLTGQRNLGRHYRWREWAMHEGRRFDVQSGREEFTAGPGRTLSRIAGLEPERFSDLETYIEKLNEKELDIAVVLDCTSSMSGEIADAQAGISDMLMFIGDVVGRARFGLVGYRDRRDEFEVKGWPFMTTAAEAQQALFTLSAEGGGDTPEAVWPALKAAYTQLEWDPEHSMVLVLVGDAPPHVGLGAHCIEYAGRGYREHELITHVVQCQEQDVEHFPEIAEAGGGRLVKLDDDDSLVAEITGLTFSGAFEAEFREFFHIYLELCR